MLLKPQALQEAQELRARESEILKANKRYASDLRVAKERVEELEAELSELKEDHEKEKKQDRAAISKLTTDNEKAEQRIEALESEKKNISKHVWNLTDEIKVQSAKLGEAEEEIQLLKSKASKAEKAHQASSKKLKGAVAELGKVGHSFICITDIPVSFSTSHLTNPIYFIDIRRSPCQRQRQTRPRRK